MTKTNKIIYWTSTVLLSLGMLSGGIFQIIRYEDSVKGLIKLGYPIYFSGILGTWKILGVIAILIPRFKLLKEWAYAGFFFAMSGAFISHILSGDGVAEFMGSLIFTILTILSWYFRPADRKFINEHP